MVAQGSPPRVRRAVRHRVRPAHAGGVTSARAESGLGARTPSHRPWGHLRACGERRHLSPLWPRHGGSPPRVRRAAVTAMGTDHYRGVTSARAESGAHHLLAPAPTWGSPPRVRRAGMELDAAAQREGVTSARAESGSISTRVNVDVGGSPPRVRRADAPNRTAASAGRVTSARAESGLGSSPVVNTHGGHLRACGERSSGRGRQNSSWGSPPRVRRAGGLHQRTSRPRGVTSARAESGASTSRAAKTNRGHLRACGERRRRADLWLTSSGSPPRVRRAGALRGDLEQDRGVTSARAESGSAPPPPRRRKGGHLRACGERGLSQVRQCRCGGSPPRVRRAGQVDTWWNLVLGVTSARAESGTSTTTCRRR